MAVPGSGEISLARIYFELTANDYDDFDPSDPDIDEDFLSLTNFSTGANPPNETINTGNDSSNRPDGSAPHAMSEFYGYDHDLVVVPTWSSVFSNFLIEEVEGGTTEVSALKTATLNNKSVANVTISISSVLSNSGTLAVSVSTSGDPGTNGTGNSATGFTNEGTTITINNSSINASSQIFYIRFRYTSHSSSVSDGRTFSLNHGFVGVNRTVTVSTLVAGKSDRRLKTNIERIGYSDMNIPIYLFNFKDNLNTTYKGVMAQDLLELGFKDSVVLDSDGYYSVKYNTIDVDMEII